MIATEEVSPLTLLLYQHLTVVRTIKIQPSTLLPNKINNSSLMTSQYNISYYMIASLNTQRYSIRENCAFKKTTQTTLVY